MKFTIKLKSDENANDQPQALFVGDEGEPPKEPSKVVIKFDLDSYHQGLHDINEEINLHQDKRDKDLLEDVEDQIK